MISSEGCTLKISAGDLVLSDSNGNVKWRAGITGASTVVNFDGLILVQDENGKVLWSIRGASGSILLIQNCQLVIANGDAKVWSSSDGFLTTTTLPTTSTLLQTSSSTTFPLTSTTLAPISSLSAGNTLASNQVLTSAEGCTLKIINDDLVLSDSNETVKWSAGVTGASTIVNFEGSILVQDANSKVLWSIRGASGSVLLIQNCDLVLVNGATKIWSSTDGYITTTSSTTEKPTTTTSTLKPTTSTQAPSTTTLAPIFLLPSDSSLTSSQVMTSVEGCTLKISGGDLVLTDSSGNVKWRAGIPGASAVVNFDGSILVQDANLKILWSIRGPSDSVLSIQNCQLALINKNAKIWSSTDGFITTTSKFD